MYFNESREDTNIDNEFKNKNKFNFDFQKLKLPIIITTGIILLIIIIVIITSIINNKTRYYLTLEGNEEITIYAGTVYNELGYQAFDNKQNNYDSVTISGDVDANTVGTYIITYTFNDIIKKRTVNVIEGNNENTFLHLNGDIVIHLPKNSTYNEPGYSAIDIADGDLTDKVIVSGKVDTTSAGTYKLVYFIANSKGITTSVARTVIVE